MKIDHVFMRRQFIRSSLLLFLCSHHFAWIALVIGCATVLGLVIASLPSIYSIVIIGLLASLIGIYLVWRFDLWMVLFVAAFPMQGFSLLGGDSANFRLSHLFLMILALKVIFGYVIKKRTYFREPGLLDIFVALFAFISLSSILWTEASLSRASVGAFKLILNIAIYLIIASIAFQDLERVLAQISLGYAIASIYMFATTAYAVVDYGVSNVFAGLAVSTVSGAPSLSVLAGLTGVLAGDAGRNIIASWFVLGLFLMWGTLSVAWKELHFIARAFWISSVMFSVMYVGVSFSRTAWVTMVIGIILMFLLGRPRIPRSYWGVLGILLLVLATILSRLGIPGLIISRIVAIGDPADLGAGRFVIWQIIFRRFVDAPFFGTGLNSLVEFVQDMPIADGANNPHNIYIRILGELGLVGFIPFTAILFTSILGVWYYSSRKVPREKRMPIVGIAVALLSYAIQGVSEYSFEDIGIWMLLGLSAAIVSPDLRSKGLRRLAFRVYPAGKY